MAARAKQLKTIDMEGHVQTNETIDLEAESVGTDDTTRNILKA